MAGQWRLTKKYHWQMTRGNIIGIIIGKALGNWQRIDAEGNSIAPAAGGPGGDRPCLRRRA